MAGKSYRFIIASAAAAATLTLYRCDLINPENNDPVIHSTTATPDTVYINETLELYCDASDEDGDDLTFEWSSNYGSFPDGSTGAQVTWQAPGNDNPYRIDVTVSDGEASVTDNVFVRVIRNHTPVIRSFQATPPTILPGGTTALSCTVTDADGDSLTISWSASHGSFLGATDGYETGWQGPDESLTSCIYLDVTDGRISIRDTLYIALVDTVGQLFRLGNTEHMIPMVWIPAGSYLRGAPWEYQAGDDESPVQEVQLANGFWIAKFEVTQSQWESVMGDWQFFFNGHPEYPAEMLSWNDAQNFIDSLNTSETDTLWRLPTEAEREYAARAGYYDTRFWWGNDIYYYELNDHAWWEINSGAHPHNVGTTPGGTPNPWGLWDMSGNVWEWCADWYHWDYDGAPLDGSAWLGTSTGMRSMRGGSWNSNGLRCRPAMRSWYYPTGRINEAGLRLVRNP